MLTDIILGPGLSPSSKRYTPQQVQYINQECRQVIDGLLEDVRETPTPPSISYQKAIEALLETHYPQHLQFYRDRHRFQKEQNRLREAGEPYSGIDSFYGRDNQLALERMHAEIDVYKKFRLENPFYIGFDEAGIPDDFIMTIDLDGKKKELSLELSSQENIFSRQVFNAELFDRLKECLEGYWGLMGFYSTMDRKSQSMQHFHEARQESHRDVGNVLRQNLNAQVIGTGGWHIGAGWQRPLATLLGITWPSPKNPLPKVIIETNESYAPANGEMHFQI